MQKIRYNIQLKEVINSIFPNVEFELEESKEKHPNGRPKYSTIKCTIGDFHFKGFEMWVESPLGVVLQTPYRIDSDAKYDHRKHLNNKELLLKVLTDIKNEVPNCTWYGGMRLDPKKSYVLHTHSSDTGAENPWHVTELKYDNGYFHFRSVYNSEEYGMCKCHVSRVELSK